MSRGVVEGAGIGSGSNAEGPARRPQGAVRSGRPIPNLRRTAPDSATLFRCSVVHCHACEGQGGPTCSRGGRCRVSRHSRSRSCDTPTPLDSDSLLTLRWCGKAQSGACIAEGAPDGPAPDRESLLGCRRT